MTNLLCAFVLFISSCPSSDMKDMNVRDDTTIQPGKVLIVYLSRTNNTKAIAEIIHENMGGTLVPLELEKPYPENYQATVQQVANENEKGYLPPLKTKIDSVENYNVVFVGFPTWGMQLPPPMKSFLKKYDLGGKTIVPFNTNGGYGIGSSFQAVKELCPNSKVLNGFTIQGGSERDGRYLVIKDEKRKEAEMQVSSWLQGLRLTGQNLNDRQQAIIHISALAATGNLSKLKGKLNAGLEARLTVNQVKEVIVHLYAYAGFPRSIRGLQTFMDVLEERKANGIKDVIGAEASPVKDERKKYDRGKAVLDSLLGAPQGSPQTGYAAFAPVIDVFLKEHLFADIFERDVLSYTDRELVTISVLSSIGGVEPMLKAHLNICLNVGLTPGQLQQFVGVIKSTIGDKEAKTSQSILDEVIKSRQQR